MDFPVSMNNTDIHNDGFLLFYDIYDIASIDSDVFQIIIASNNRYQKHIIADKYIPEQPTIFAVE